MLQGAYEPGKRHWLKVKKDYLNEGAMADTADLVVLGGFHGTGSKGVSNCLIAVFNVYSRISIPEFHASLFIRGPAACLSPDSEHGSWQFVPFCYTQVESCPVSSWAATIPRLRNGAR